MALRGAWSLDPHIAFLNHGSYGATPAAVLEEQSRLRLKLETNPVDFMVNELPGMWAEAVRLAAEFVAADPGGFAFVTNATAGISTVLASLPLGPGDEIMITDHGYEACNLAVEAAAARSGAAVVTAKVSSVVSSGEEVRAAIAAAVTPRTRWAIIDHVTSPTALVWPIEVIVADLADRAVGTIVDGAHAPGQLPLDVVGMGAAAYTGNWHKWVCGPKGSGFLWLGEGLRELVMPLVVSHGAGTEGAGRFRAMFDWGGTADPTPHLCVPAAVRVVGEMLAGGWPEVRQRNRDVVLQGRDLLIDRFGLVPCGPPSLIGSMASFVVPSRWLGGGSPTERAERLGRRLAADGVVVAVATRRGSDDVFLRVSAHLHTGLGDFARLADSLQAL